MHVFSGCLLCGDVFVVKGEAFGKGIVSVMSDTPSSGSWDFGNEAVDVEALQEAADRIGLSSALGDGSCLVEEVFSDVLIAEAHQGVFATQHGFEQGQVMGINGIEASIGTPLVPAWPSQFAQGLLVGYAGWGATQRLKVVVVGTERYFPISVEVGHPFGHGIPAHHQLSLAPAHAADLELSRMVDHCFYA